MTDADRRDAPGPRRRHPGAGRLALGTGVWLGRTDGTGGRLGRAGRVGCVGRLGTVRPG